MNILRKRHILLILTLAASMAFCLVPSATSAAERTVNPGHHHVDVDIYKVPASEQGGISVQGTETYPDKLDPRNEDWYKSNIEVRDQYNSNLCWSFSANKAAMISYAKECYENTEEVPKVNELSPIHLGFFFYNRVNDPMGNTDGDKNLNWGEENWFEQGGSVVNTFQHMATWSGLSNENTAPFKTKTDPSTGNTVYAGPMQLSDKLAYKDELIETDCTFYDDVRTHPDKLKYVVDKYGAAVVSLFFGNDNRPLEGTNQDPDNSLMNGCNFFNPDGYQGDNNHEVVVVGWDDDYPKENFVSAKHAIPTGSWPEDQPYTVDEYVSPQHDGAWLVMNSWGKDWAQNGYFWVSYDSEDILSDGVCGFDMAAPDTYEYNFQYDGNANNRSYILSKGDIAANVFKNTTNETIRLDAVGFTEFNDGPTDFDLNVYKNLTDPDAPTSGNLESFQTVTTHTPGYKTFQLDIPVEIDPGQTYSIAVTAKSPKTYFGSEMATAGSYEASLGAGQSFGWDPEGGWEDMAVEYDSCYRIKGLASETVPQPTSTTTTTAAPTTDPSQGGGGSDIVLKATKIKKISKGKKSLTVKWKKSRQIVEGKHVTGYQVRYSLKRNMKNAKTVTVKGFAKTSKKIKKLKKKKTYYVQVRTVYIDDRGAEHFSAWSKKKSKKTR